MKRNVNIGSSLSLPSFVLWFVFGAWVGSIFLVIMTLITNGF